MKHTYKQAKKAMNNLINYFGYRKSDFYDDVTKETPYTWLFRAGRKRKKDRKI